MRGGAAAAGSRGGGCTQATGLGCAALAQHSAPPPPRTLQRWPRQPCSPGLAALPLCGCSLTTHWVLSTLPMRASHFPGWWCRVTPRNWLAPLQHAAQNIVSWPHRSLSVFSGRASARACTAHAWAWGNVASMPSAGQHTALGGQVGFPLLPAPPTGRSPRCPAAARPPPPPGAGPASSPGHQSTPPPGTAGQDGEGRAGWMGWNWDSGWVRVRQVGRGGAAGGRAKADGWARAR